LKADKDLFSIVEVPDESSRRCGQFLDEGRGGDNLLAFGESRLLIDIYDLKVGLILQVYIANPSDVFDRPTGSGRCPGNVEAKATKTCRDGSKWTDLRF
jgi:hypothetical protein